ncbi:uncharacterized protein LOC122848128 isoform X2 [Aphidius gifuensis]|uniref:uncharacterized protein LOC122848128 isoform X2 n=1 Tax=Aphidius gifuensis TaxID=684658 RepID=UPI001CDBFF5E|nr:uncharacterized protein LOC122848128 isoform X2 [Aphidius gifuensis]
MSVDKYKRLPISSQPEDGLNLLGSLDKFFIDHQNNQWELFTGKDCYPIVDVNGKLLVFVQKLLGRPGVTRFGDSKNWNSWIYNNVGQEVFRLEKFNFGEDVFSGAVKLGTILKKTSWCPTINILNDEDVHVLTLKGRLLGLDTQHKFKIFTMDDNEIGEIKRTFLDEKKDYFSNDNYVATFPLSLDVKWKAILMAVMILMDFTYSKR